jgi:hypothetical protein
MQVFGIEFELRAEEEAFSTVVDMNAEIGLINAYIW